MSRINDPADIGSAFDAAHSWQVFGHADVWIGALIGAAMIYGAIRLRRWREEG